jgi:hypothetical protein
MCVARPETCTTEFGSDEGMLTSGAKSTTQAFAEITRQLIFEAARTSNAVIFGDNAQSASKVAAAAIRRSMVVNPGLLEI